MLLLGYLDRVGKRMAKTQIEKQYTQMSGEFGVVSELFRRKIQATISYGNSKSADVFVISAEGANAARIEVKTSVVRRWIVGAQAEIPLSHVVWVFVHMPKASDAVSRAQVAEMGKSSPSYHVMTSQEVYEIHALKKSLHTNSGPIVFEFSDVQFCQNMWHKVAGALASIVV